MVVFHTAVLAYAASDRAQTVCRRGPPLCVRWLGDGAAPAVFPIDRRDGAPRAAGRFLLRWKKTAEPGPDRMAIWLDSFA